MIYYDQQESANEAMATAQVEYDRLCFESALFDAAMTCTDAGDTRLDDYLPLICRANGLQYPPRQLESLPF